MKNEPCFAADFSAASPDDVIGFNRSGHRSCTALHGGASRRLSATAHAKQRNGMIGIVNGWLFCMGMAVMLLSPSQAMAAETDALADTVWVMDVITPDCFTMLPDDGSPEILSFTSSVTGITYGGYAARGSYKQDPAKVSGLVLDKGKAGYSGICITDIPQESCLEKVIIQSAHNFANDDAPKIDVFVNDRPYTVAELMSEQAPPTLPGVASNINKMMRKSYTLSRDKLGDFPAGRSAFAIRRSSSTSFSPVLSKITVWMSRPRSGEGADTEVRPVLSFGPYSHFEMTMQGIFNEPQLIAPEGMEVMFTSSDKSVAQVGAQSGVVVQMGLGEATITATEVRTDSKTPATASYTISVVASRPPFVPMVQMVDGMSLALSHGGKYAMMPAAGTVSAALPAARIDKDKTGAITVPAKALFKIISVVDGNIMLCDHSGNYLAVSTDGTARTSALREASSRVDGESVSHLTAIAAPTEAAVWTPATAGEGALTLIPLAAPDKALTWDSDKQAFLLADRTLASPLNALVDANASVESPSAIGSVSLNSSGPDNEIIIDFQGRRLNHAPAGVPTIRITSRGTTKSL